KNALSDIDLHIKSGETIGVIGGTGSGKSTLVNLICRLYDVDEGSVCVGGVDVRKYDTEVLRNQVSVVLQKNTLFSGTILDNLRWGNPDATDEECIAACKAACADEFIDRIACRTPTAFWCWITAGSTPLTPTKTCSRPTRSIRRSTNPRSRAAVTSTSRPERRKLHETTQSDPSGAHEGAEPRLTLYAALLRAALCAGHLLYSDSRRCHGHRLYLPPDLGE